MDVRDATEEDLPAINAIYNEVLLSSNAIYEDEPATLDERREWWQSRRAAQCPVLVADEDGVAGFATYGEFRHRSGYRHTVEGSIHIRRDARGRGAGRLLLQALLERARAAGKHSMIAGVDSGNTGSLHFLERNGFARVGYLPEVGLKAGKYLDLVLLQYRFGALEQ